MRSIAFKVDFEKFSAEMVVLREFIDFINGQVAAYSDCLAGFEGNVVRIERQVARVRRPVGRRIEQGEPVILWASVEDPSSPDVIHQTITRAADFVSANSEKGNNERFISWAIIVFLFSYWDEDVRPRIAKIREVETKEVKVDVFGDLRLIRNSIVHNGGTLDAKQHARLKCLGGTFAADSAIAPGHAEMHKIFTVVKSALGDIIIEYTGHLPGAPKKGELRDIAFQNFGPRPPRE